MIAALATPWGESALAVVRTSGVGSIEKLDTVFHGIGNKPEVSIDTEQQGPKNNKSGKLSVLPGFRMVRGIIVDPQSRETVDDVIAAVYRKPRSYTGEDSVELFVHGSLPGIQKIMEVLYSLGFRDAEPGEFTLRAFINGKLDLTRAEAVNEIVTAKTKQAQTLAFHRLSGSVERAVQEVKNELTALVSVVELQLDYSEDEGEAEDRPVPPDALEELGAKCIALGKTFSTGRLYQQGVRVVLAGKTNAGKSSLFNLFLKEDRAIVSEVHGTTRDYLESWITLRGIPLLLYDTAGLRSAGDPVETEGIRRTEKVLAQADIVLYIVDAGAGIEKEDVRRLSRIEKECPCLRIWNKIDVAEEQAPEGYYPLSTVEMHGFHAIEETLITMVIDSTSAAASINGPVIDSLRQKECLNRAAEALHRAEDAVRDGMPLDMTAVELQDALQALGEITGEVTSADILDSIFSRFCVGK